MPPSKTATASTPSTRGEIREAVDEALNLLDHGVVRVAEKGEDGNWQVNQWLKKAVLLSFRLNPMGIIRGAWPRRIGLVGQGAVQIRRLEPARSSRRPVSAPFPTARCAVPPISPPALCSCHPLSISAPMSMKERWSIRGQQSDPAPRSERTCTCPAASHRRRARTAAGPARW